MGIQSFLGSELKQATYILGRLQSFKNNGSKPGYYWRVHTRRDLG